MVDKGKDYACKTCDETERPKVQVCHKIILVRYVHEFLNQIKLFFTLKWKGVVTLKKV